MNNDNLVLRLKELVDEGEFLLHSGYEISANAPLEVASPVFNWLLKSNSLITQVYGKNSSEMKEFQEAYTIRMSINLLVSLAANEVLKGNSERKGDKVPEPEQTGRPLSRAQITELAQEQAKRVFFLLENSVKPELKINAIKLLERVLNELASAQPHWDLVSSLLKSGFDYGIPFGTELAQLAHIYYNSHKTI